MTRPAFKAALAAAQRIYDPTQTQERVAEVIGGKVAVNILHADPKLQWKNTCAVRVSYVLNQCGVRIPYSGDTTVSGSDGSWYFYRIGDVTRFLAKRLGKQQVVKYPPAGGGALAGMRGLVVFEISGWTDAGGHATLWDGGNCYDSCYFNTPGATYRTDRANFWALP